MYLDLKRFASPIKDQSQLPGQTGSYIPKTLFPCFILHPFKYLSVSVEIKNNINNAIMIFMPIPIDISRQAFSVNMSDLDYKMCVNRVYLIKTIYCSYSFDQ